MSEYCTVDNQGNRYSKQFATDREAFEWNQGFTDGPELYSLEKIINGARCEWDIVSQSWEYAK